MAAVQKRKHLPDELRQFFPLLGMNLERAVEHVRVTGSAVRGHAVVIRALGEFTTMDLCGWRLNVRLDQDGKIVELDGLY